MPWRRKVPSPTWRSFLHNRLTDIAAIDMFVWQSRARACAVNEISVTAKSIPSGSLRAYNVHCMFQSSARRISFLQTKPLMPSQIVITEKTSQAKDVRAAVGSRYGDILPAEGHLFDLLEPEDVVPAWKRWSPILLRPEGLYDTRPATGGNKAAKLKAICEALRTAKRV